MNRRPRFMYRWALQKKSRNARCQNGINNLPIEILSKIFEYLSTSDILRCSRTCSHWFEACQQNDIWRIQFKRLPPKVQKLSTEAKKPTANINWRRETVSCLKKCRKRQTALLLKKKSRYSALPEKATEALKYLDVRWTVIVVDASGKEYELVTKDVFYYTTSISVCWNDMALPVVGRLSSCSIYAQCPLFRDAKGKAKENSACTRALFATLSLKGDVFDHMNAIGSDQYISSYVLSTGLVFGLWHDDLMPHRNVAYINLHLHSLNIVGRILKGTCGRPYTTPPHQPILDDLDGKYGLQRYSALIELRTSRKLLWNHKVLEFLRGHVEDGYLVMTDERTAYQSCFDIHNPIRLPWKAGAIKGIIKNLAVLDFSLIDCNEEFMWHTSQVIKATPVKPNDVNFEDKGSENLQIILTDEQKGWLKMNIAVDPESDCCAVRRIQIRLKISFINSWFGTSY